MEDERRRSRALILKLILCEFDKCDTESHTSCGETPESKDNFHMFCFALLRWRWNYSPFPPQKKSVCFVGGTAMKKFKSVSSAGRKQIFVTIRPISVNSIPLDEEKCCGTFG